MNFKWKTYSRYKLNLYTKYIGCFQYYPSDNVSYSIMFFKLNTTPDIFYLYDSSYHEFYDLVNNGDLSISLRFYIEASDDILSYINKSNIIGIEYKDYPEYHNIKLPYEHLPLQIKLQLSL